MVFSTSSCPRSMRLAMATSPSRVSSGTVPISRRYMRTGSLVFSSIPGVRSSSLSSAAPAGSSLTASASAGSAASSAGARHLGRGRILVNVDAVALEGGEQVVDFFRGVNFRRQDIVYFVVEQVAPLLAHGDELTYLIVFFF